MDKQIELINDIIFNAILHGADCGGSYDSNRDGLIASIEKWLNFNKIKGYAICRIEREGWFIYQMVKEKDNG